MAKVQIAYESRSDISAIRADGYTDGLVNSDQAYDSATEELRGGLVTEAAIEAQVVEWSEEYRRETLSDMKRPAKEQQSLAEFITHGEGNKVRSQKEQQELLESYLDAWRAGFRQRLRKGVGAMRNEAHECAEGCGCESSSAYLDQVQQSLADLGSDDPAGDVARNAKYVRGAKKAGLAPNQAAAMIMAMSQRDPADYQPRYRYEDVAGETAAKEQQWSVLRSEVTPASIPIRPGDTFTSSRLVSTHYLRNRFPNEVWFVTAVTGEQLTIIPSGAVRPGRMARKSRSSYRPGDLFVIEWFVENGSKKGGEREFSDKTSADDFYAALVREGVDPSDIIQFLREPGAGESSASEYVAVDHRGKKVFGPTRDYGEARMHADRAAGTVRFVMGARESGASEGPHAQPFNVAPSVHACTVDSATAIAAQIPGGPWKYLKTYPKEAPARIERRKDFDVKMPDGSMGRVTANFCGKHLLLRCPVTQKQFLFESVCVGDVPGPAGLPPRPEVQPVKGKPFTVKIRRGRDILKESGPFAKVTEAVQSFQDKSSFESGDMATVYDGAKVADYRGGRAVFVFGRTRWSRA